MCARWPVLQFSPADGHTNDASFLRDIEHAEIQVPLISRPLTCRAGWEYASGRLNKFPAARDRALILWMMKSSSSQTDFTCINGCCVTAVNPLMEITPSWASLEAERLIHSKGFASFVRLFVAVEFAESHVLNTYSCNLPQFNVPNGM